jgi:two-component system, NtrC family, nitrogen regulation response regulator NtrX
MFPSILIVDDEPSILQSLGGLLSDEGFEVTTASNGYEALKIVEVELPDLVLLDIWMPGIDGIETLKEIKKSNPLTQVIIFTGHGTIETAVKTIKLGAYDMIEKPLSIDKVIVTINNALNFRRLEEENRYLRKKTIEKNSITGNSSATVELRKQIAMAAPRDAWIMITGENGTGKELVARTIHQLSHRSEYPLVDVNCAAIPEKHIESELFGHEKGAFEGANTRSRGKFELADKGTLFLDEIGDMSLKAQGKILRVLQEQQFQRLGGSRIISMNVRIIAASNKDLEKEMEKGNFREDLFYRLNVIPIMVHPLRSRVKDVPILVETFLHKFSIQNHSRQKSVSKKALSLLSRYPWPGNVRELRNLVERLDIMGEGDIIQESDIPEAYRSGVEKGQGGENQFFTIPHLKVAKSTFEKEFIRRKLIEQKHNVTRTAEAIGVARSYLHKKLKEQE